MPFSIRSIPYSYIPKKKRENEVSIEFQWGNFSDIPQLEQIVKFLSNNINFSKKTFENIENRMPSVFRDKKQDCYVSTLFYHYFHFEENPGLLLLLEDIIKTNPIIEDIRSLRLYVWNYIGNKYDGFLNEVQRNEAITEICNNLEIAINQLEDLLWLDLESNKVLVKHREINLRDVVFLYNFHLLESILRNSKSITFRISNLPGSITKSLVLKLKFSPVYFEIKKDMRDDNEIFLFQIFLPDQISAPKIKYGNILSSITFYIFDKLQKADIKFEMELTIKIGKRTFLWKMSNSFLSLIRYPWNINWDENESLQQYETDLEKELESNYLNMDSKIETAFYQIFKDEEWQIKHEPNTILAKDGTIFIPDFSLSNKFSTILLEIVGFWTNDYIKKKIDKLNKLIEFNILKHPLILLIDQNLKDSFSKEKKIASNFPIIYYDYNYFSIAVNKLHLLLKEKYSGREKYKDEIRDRLDSAIILIQKEIKLKGILSYKEIKNIYASIDVNVPAKFIKKTFNEPKIFNILIKNKLFPIKSLGVISTDFKNSIINQMRSILKKDQSISNIKLKKLLNTSYDSIDPLDIIKNLSEFEIVWKSLLEFQVKWKSTS